MADIGSATVRVTPNMTGIQSKIAAGFKGSAGPATAALGDEVNKNSGPFQNAIGKLGGVAKVGGLAVAAGMAAGAAGIAALTKKALLSGAELEQQLGGSEAVFGKYATSIQNTALTAYTKMGLSQNEFLQGANKMGSLFQGAGFSVQSSMKMSQESMQRASDIASIMGISTTDALEAVTGMAKGNFTMMDNLGVAMNDTAIGAYALSKGINKTTQQMSIQEKVGLAQQMFMEKTAKYAGNYAKENDTLSGSLNTTKKAFEDFMAGGNTVDNFVKSLVSTIKIAVPQIVAILPDMVNGIGQVLSALVPAISASLPVLIPALIKAATDLVMGLVTAMPQLIQVLLLAMPMLINGFIQLFLALIKALPQIITMIANAMPRIIDSLVNGLTNPTALTAIIMGTVQLLLAIIKAIPIIIPALVRALPTILRNIVGTLTSPAFISGMINSGVSLIKALITGIVSIGGAVAGAAGKVLKVITDTLSPGNLAKIGGNMIKGLWDGIKDLTGWITGKLQSFGDGVLKGIKDFFGIKSPSRVFAEVGRDLDRGLAKGVLDNSGIVSKSIDSMANDALTAVTMPLVSGDVALGSSASAGAGAGAGSTTNQDVNIGRIVLGDASAVKEMFKQLNQDTINVGMGLTPIQGANQP